MMKLWERIHRGMEAGFDATLATVHNITEKAGESINLTRLRREKARLETQLTRLLAKLGNTVYEKISQIRDDEIAQKLGIEELIKEIASNEARVVDIDFKLGKELKKEPKENKPGKKGKVKEESVKKG
jgi:hypothetical protein